MTNSATYASGKKQAELTVGVIGLGAFGLFARERFGSFPNVEVLGYDPDPRRPSNGSFEQAARCHIVVLAVPIPAYEQVLLDVLKTNSSGMILDVATVKLHTAELFRRHASHRESLWTHPLFGPQSFAQNGNSLKGLQIVITGSNKVEIGKYEKIRSLLEDSGLVVIEMSPDEHDRTIVGEEQLVTQLVGRIIKKAGFARNKLNAHTLSARHFYLAMEIVGDDDELFRIVCQYNPYWKEIEDRFQEAFLAVRRELNGVA
jgi:prephenate dehydrogenase